MTKRIVKKADSKVVRGSGVGPIVEQFKQVDAMLKMWMEKKKELHGRLMGVLEEQGVEDDTGHMWFELPEEVSGVHQLCRQKRVSQILQEDVVERELKKLGLYDQCTTQITVLDEDAVLALGFEGEIPEKVMAKFYDEKITYALVFK